MMMQAFWAPYLYIALTRECIVYVLLCTDFMHFALQGQQGSDIDVSEFKMNLST
jgi:hypothetical protein